MTERLHKYSMNVVNFSRDCMLHISIMPDAGASVHFRVQVPRDDIPA